MAKDLSILYLITARGGSKGIPGKNIKPLNGKPLILHTLEHALAVADEADICVSTDSDEIIEVVESSGFKVDFKRPDELATDTAGSYEVMVHALDYYKERGKEYDALVLLQPTSPFRKPEDITNAIELYTDDIDMVVGVTETKSNPYYLLYEENEEGLLEKSKKGTFVRRQDCPMVYEVNGAVYVMNVKSLRKYSHRDFTRIRKYMMDEYSSIDLDTPLDWDVAEFITARKQQ